MPNELRLVYVENGKRRSHHPGFLETAVGPKGWFRTSFLVIKNIRRNNWFSHNIHEIES